MQLKIGGTQLTCQVANKCLNLPEQMEVVERNKEDPIPSPAVLWIISVCERKSWLKKTLKKKNVFLLWKKLNFRSWEIQRFLHIKDHILQKIWLIELFFQSISRVTKRFSWKKKTNAFYKKYLPIASSGIVISQKSLWSLPNTPCFVY